MQGDLK